MKNWKNIMLVCVVFAGCKKAYNPSITITPAGYLVVEGVVNAGADSTIIQLSRTVGLSNKISSKAELNALVTVQDDQNISYPLLEIGGGKYASAGLNLSNGHKYRLSIKTSNTGQYFSDYMEVLNSPLIDSVSYDTKGTLSSPGLNLYVNTHDPANKVLYYKWDYQETWMFHSNFASYFKSNGDTVLGRDLINDDIYTCWQSDTSSTIVLGSSASLSKNVIVNSPVTSIISSSEKLGIEYSILVRQYALTSDAYQFYVNIKKNTEQLGSIFDALPSQINGNLHSVTNPGEPVIGFVSVGSISTKRIFITNRQLPNWATTPFYSTSVCRLEFETMPCCFYGPPDGSDNEVDFYINYNKGGSTSPLIPIDAIGVPGHPPIGYTATTKECTDCTLRGTNKKSLFWQ